MDIVRTDGGRTRKLLCYVRPLKDAEGRCHPSKRKWVGEDLKRARQGVGSTVFDWLIEIIQVHCAGGREQENGVELELE